MIATYHKGRMSNVWFAIFCMLVACAHHLILQSLLEDENRISVGELLTVIIANILPSTVYMFVPKGIPTLAIGLMN